MKITGCSMGCLYATGPIGKCLCPCAGTSHGLLANRPIAARCSPAVEVRCKGGNENGACRCACGGVNHGLYREIPDFDAIPVKQYAI